MSPGIGGAVGLAPGADAWYLTKLARPPQLDRAATAAALRQCSAEVGACQLVVLVDDSEVAGLRASAAQRSDDRIAACGRALELVAGPGDPERAADIDAQLSDINELDRVQRAHTSAGRSYAATIGKRSLYLMDVVREQEDRILALGAQERLKAVPNPQILAATGVVEEARRKDAQKKQATQQDHEARAAGASAEIAALKSELARVMKLNDELLQGQMRERQLRQEAESKSGLSVGAGGTGGGGTGSGGDRRHGGR